MLLLLLASNNQSDLANLNWAQAADKLSTELASLDSKTLFEAGFQSSTEVLSRFAAMRSITVNSVRRQIAAAAFLKNILEPAEFKDVTEWRCPPFNDVEFLKKIYDIDQAEANSLLKAVLDRKISRAALTKQYQELLKKTPNQRHRLAVRRSSTIDFQSQIINALRISTHQLYPKIKPTDILQMTGQLKNFSFGSRWHLS